MRVVVSAVHSRRALAPGPAAAAYGSGGEPTLPPAPVNRGITTGSFHVRVHFLASPPRAHQDVLY